MKKLLNISKLNILILSFTMFSCSVSDSIDNPISDKSYKFHLELISKRYLIDSLTIKFTLEIIDSLKSENTDLSRYTYKKVISEGERKLEVYKGKINDVRKSISEQKIVDLESKLDLLLNDEKSIIKIGFGNQLTLKNNIKLSSNSMSLGFNILFKKGRYNDDRNFTLVVTDICKGCIVSGSKIRLKDIENKVIWFQSQTVNIEDKWLLKHGGFENDSESFNFLQNRELKSLLIRSKVKLEPTQNREYLFSKKDAQILKQGIENMKMVRSIEIELEELRGKKF